MHGRIFSAIFGAIHRDDGRPEPMSDPHYGVEDRLALRLKPDGPIGERGQEDRSDAPLATITAVVAFPTRAFTEIRGHG
ncbi:hypothetical protein RGUI_0869 [Rhodovulum sp. P5]|uniref:hypothetical protein n=1 Tax=Rhodovulum sp. P5 TaxID=1564506 RepID=UPI0009C231A1|nr:hypothetical protein [Rhodovulum sp. P5]ARE39010.1 hypothetical protein RGUI_0869 [Rhodovulum sp. P5]